MIAIRPVSAQAQVYFVLFASFALAALQNVTVDDSLMTGPVVPIYLPSSSDWNQGNTCSGCYVQPDPTKAYNGTWHDTTSSLDSANSPAFQFTFLGAFLDLLPKVLTGDDNLHETGSGLYIFFILANSVPGATTFTSVNFLLDGGQGNSFTHEPSSSTDYQYNQPVYANNSIPYGLHTMQVAYATNSVLVLFDYLIYTCVYCFAPQEAILTRVPISTDTDSTTTTMLSATSSGPAPTQSGTPTSSSGTLNGLDIFGIVFGGVAVVALVIVCPICYRRYKRRAGGRSATASYFGLSSYEILPSPAEV